MINSCEFRSLKTQLLRQIVAEHYGAQAANLKLLSRFFTKYPELSDRAYVVVKVGDNPSEPGCADDHREVLEPSMKGTKVVSASTSRPKVSASPPKE